MQSESFLSIIWNLKAHTDQILTDAIRAAHGRVSGNYDEHEPSFKPPALLLRPTVVPRPDWPSSKQKKIQTGALGACSHSRAHLRLWEGLPQWLIDATNQFCQTFLLQKKRYIVTDFQTCSPKAHRQNWFHSSSGRNIRTVYIWTGCGFRSGSRKEAQIHTKL